MARKMQIVSVRMKDPMLATIEEAASETGVSLSQYMRDSAWGAALRPTNPAVREWMMMIEVVRVLSPEVVAGVFASLDDPPS